MQIPQPVRLDATDRAILAALGVDGRLTNSALARRVHLAESTCAYRVRALREAGVIEGFTVRINPAALGRPLQAVIKIRLGSHDGPRVRELFDRLTEVPGAMSVLHVAGADDFHLHVAVGSAEQLRDLVLEHITVHPVVRSTETHLVFEERAGRGLADALRPPGRA